MSAHFTARVKSHEASVNDAGWNMVVELEVGYITLHGGKELIQTFPVGSKVTVVVYNEEERK